MGTQKKVDMIDFHPHHLDVMEIRQEEMEGIMALDDAFTRFEAMAKMSIDCKTFVSDGRIIFCAGFFQLWPGVIECWMVPSKYVENSTLQFCKILRQYVHDIIEEYKCHRFQTTAPDDELHARWMKFLGLEKEGILRKYDHNQKNHCIYSRIV